MTRNETIQLLAMLSVSYPRFAFTPDETTVNMWHGMLKDLPGDVVGVATQRMIATLKFPPTIADIREAVANAAQDAKGSVDAGEAWRRVVKAIGLFGYYRGDQAREYLGEDIWRAVEMVGGWCDLCISEDSEAVRSAQFERRYTAMMQQHSQAIQIPASVREDMKRLVQPMMERMMLEHGENAEAAAD